VFTVIIINLLVQQSSTRHSENIDTNTELKRG